jgi:hypothetical protein
MLSGSVTLGMLRIAWKTGEVTLEMLLWECFPRISATLWKLDEDGGCCMRMSVNLGMLSDVCIGPIVLI